MKALAKSVSNRVTMSDLMKEFIKEPELKSVAEKLTKFIHQIIEELNQMPEDKKRRQLKLEVINEKQILDEAKIFLERELKTKIFIYSEEDAKRYDPKRRAESARPRRPAIYIE